MAVNFVTKERFLCLWTEGGVCVSAVQLQAALALPHAGCCSQLQAWISAHCQSPVNGAANAAGQEGVRAQTETMQT